MFNKENKLEVVIKGKSYEFEFWLQTNKLSITENTSFGSMTTFHRTSGKTNAVMLINKFIENLNNT